MHMIAGVLQYVAVASFAEAWIEKILYNVRNNLMRSPPSRRRGLKMIVNYISKQETGRLLRGGVD